MEKLCTKVEDKLRSLLSFLTQLPGKLELIADEIDNENLRNALVAVAAESHEYASELTAQLRKLHISTPAPELYNLEEALTFSDEVPVQEGHGKELQTICERSESFFSTLYTDLLNDYHYNTSLKDMMQYQLMGIRSAFLRIRFLNKLRYTH